MGMIPPETIEAVAAATDIVEQISKYVQVKRAGSQYKALCPFHDERTPSFSISPQKQTYHCFGCQASGNVFSFVMQYENLPFLDTVKKLATQAGIPIIEEKTDPKELQKKEKRSRLILLHTMAAEFMHHKLLKSPSAAHGRAYLKSRGFDSSMAKRWKIGWMPENPQEFIQWAKENKFKGRELIDGSLAGLRDEKNPARGLFVRFTNRLMFPIYNDYGDIIAFSGRQLVEDKKSGKYINSKQTLIFDKSKVFFGLDKARRAIGREKFVLLCEGQIDAISCVEHGIKNAIAPLGTAFTEHHARLLKRYTEQVYLCFDADQAGYKAMINAFKILAPHGLQVKIVSMPKGEDPDSFIKSKGIESFSSLIEQANSFFDFQYQLAKEEGLQDVNKRAILATNMAEWLALLPDKITRDTYITHVSGLLQINAQELRETIEKSQQNKVKQQQEQQGRKGITTATETESAVKYIEPSTIDHSVIVLCLNLLNSPEAMDYLGEQLEHLIDPLNDLQGGNIVLDILAKRPKSGNPAAIQAYLMTLPEADQKTLFVHFTTMPFDASMAVTLDTCTMILHHFLHKKATSLRIAMQNSSLEPSRLDTMLKELEEISNLLRNTQKSTV